MDVLRDNTHKRNGLEQLQALIASGRRPPMMDLLDISLVEIEKGRSVFEATPSKATYNPIGSVHGGFAATILDSACGCAVHSCLSAEQGYTTLELKVAFHRALTDSSGRVRAEGALLSFGRRVAFAEAKLFDAQGRLCVSATSTLLVFEIDATASA